MDTAPTTQAIPSMRWSMAPIPTTLTPEAY